MKSIESIKALSRALSTLKGINTPLNLIHHSDRGTQYCSQGYVRLLEKNNITISMTENRDPLENALAERINGIIKEEYLDSYRVKNIQQAKSILKMVVRLYNNERPHMSISNSTPNSIHHSITPIQTKRLWKNYYRKQTMFVNSEQDLNKEL